MHAVLAPCMAKEDIAPRFMNTFSMPRTCGGSFSMRLLMETKIW